MEGRNVVAERLSLGVAATLSSLYSLLEVWRSQNSTRVKSTEKKNRIKKWREQGPRASANEFR